MMIVFGSMNMDLVFQVAYAPEAGETLVIPDYQQFPGGKGANQAAAAALMGAEVMMAACVGDDGFGTTLRTVLTGKQVDCTYIAVDQTARTGSAMIVLEQNGENRIIVAAGANALARQDIIPEGQLHAKQTILMQMETSAAQVRALAQRAQGRVARTILNLAPMITPLPGTLEAVDYLILNEIEIVQLAAALGLSPDGADKPDDYKQTAQHIARHYDLTCILTLGARGAEAYDAQGLIAQAPALPLAKLVDTTGAGDAFCGALAALLDQGQSLPEALRLACIAGSLACAKLGAMSSYPYKDEVLRAASGNMQV